MGDTKLGLRLLFWSAGAQTGVRLVQSAWWRGERRFLSRNVSIESFRDAFEWFVPVFLTLAALAASTLMVIGAWRAATGAKNRAQIFFYVAMGGLALALLSHLPNAAFMLHLMERTGAPDRIWGIIFSVGYLASVLGLIALLLGMMELAKEAKLAIPWISGGVWVGLVVLEALYWQLLVRWIGFPRGPWEILLVGVDVAETVILLALIDGLATTLDAPAARPADWAQNAGWSLAADGLRSYRTALLCRILLPFGAILLLLLGIAARSTGLAMTGFIAMPLLIVVFSVWMLIGIQRFASYVPQESAARTSAGVAAKLMIASAIFDALALCVLLLILVDRSAIEHGQETSQAMGSAAQLLGVLGMFILLGSFRRVGQFVGVTDAGRRVRIVAILTGVAAALITQLQTEPEKLGRILNRMEGPEVATLLLIALAMLAAGIWSLVVYFGLLGRLRDAMTPATPQSAL
jgi:hypothetical protein